MIYTDVEISARAIIRAELLSFLGCAINKTCEETCEDTNLGSRPYIPETLPCDHKRSTTGMERKTNAETQY